MPHSSTPSSESRQEQAGEGGRERERDVQKLALNASVFAMILWGRDGDLIRTGLRICVVSG